MNKFTGKNKVGFWHQFILQLGISDLRRFIILSVLTALVLAAMFAAKLQQRPAGAQQVEQVTISGMVRDNRGQPIQDIVISVDGSRRAATLTGADGGFSVLVPKGGSYIVMPSSTGVLFAPGSLSFQGVSANISGVNFIATRVRTFKVAGHVADARGGPLTDVIIRVSDSPQILTITGPGGLFSFDYLSGGASYVLTPTKAGFTFNPPSFLISSLTRDFAGINFVGVPQDKVLISGIVTDQGGQPLPDVIVGLSGPQPSLVPTTGSGSFSFVVPAGGSYLVAPARDGYSFSPPSLTLTGVTQNVSSANFVGMRAPMVGISGYIIDGNGQPMVDVPVSISGSSNGTLPSGPIGNYAFSVLSSGTYTIVPLMPGVIFSPASRTFSNLTIDQNAVNFVGTPGIRPEQANPQATPGVPLVNLPTESPTPEASPSPSPSPSPSEEKYRPSPTPKPGKSTDKPAQDGGPKTPPNPNDKSTPPAKAAGPNTKTVAGKSGRGRAKKRKSTRAKRTTKRPSATKKRPPKRPPKKKR